MGWLLKLWDAPSETLADMFWSVATSNVVLMVIGVVVVACIIVTHVPLIRWIPTIDDYLKFAAGVGYVAAALLFLLIGFRMSEERTEAKQLRTELNWSRNQLEQQEEQAKDAERLKEEAEARAAAIKGELDDYRKSYAGRPDGKCTFSDDDLVRLRQLRRRTR